MATYAVSIPTKPGSVSAPANTFKNSAHLDAAHALLRVAPRSLSLNFANDCETNKGNSTSDGCKKVNVDSCAVADGEEEKETGYGGHEGETCDIFDSSFAWEKTLLKMRRDTGASFTLNIDSTPETSLARTTSDEPTGVNHAPCPLDALAMLASNAASMDCDDADDGETLSGHDEDVAPICRRRERSVSNPEGMEKWDILLGATLARRSDIQPTIPEDSVSDVTDTVCPAVDSPKQLPLKKRVNFSPDSNPKRARTLCDGANEELSLDQIKSASEADLKDMLCRARSKLLEDLVTGTAACPNGLLLPHSLAKYRDVYNKKGRIGIYTPAERAAIIVRFNSKRSRRVWNKKIRYSCRKNLADRRLRVKGRFVKRGSTAVDHKGIGASVESVPKNDETDGTVEAFMSHTPKNGLKTSAIPPTEHASTVTFTGEDDDNMPDVDDEEAGFIPTKDQPYRRTRRHTIT